MTLRCPLCSHPLVEPWEPNSVLTCGNCGAQKQPPHIRVITTPRDIYDAERMQDSLYDAHVEDAIARDGEGTTDV